MRPILFFKSQSTITWHLLKSTMSWHSSIKNLLGYATKEWNPEDIQRATKAAVMQRLEEATALSIFAPSLGNFVGSLSMDGEVDFGLEHFFPEWPTIRQWLAGKTPKTVRLYCQAFPAFSDDRLPKAAFMADWLLPSINGKRLTLHRVKNAKALPAKLRIIGEHKDGAFAIYDLGGQAAILDRVVSEDVFLGRALAAKDLATIEAASELLPAATVQPPQNLVRREYTPNAVRKLEEDFSFLRDANVERILISDPYITANEATFDAFREIVGIWGKLWSAVPKAIIVQYAQAPDVQETRTRETIAAKMRVFLKNLGAVDSMVFQLPRLRDRDFHDRRIEFSLQVDAAIPVRRTRRVAAAVGGAGRKSQRILVELSGGIYRLVTPGKECRLYRIKE